MGAKTHNTIMMIMIFLQNSKKILVLFGVLLFLNLNSQIYISNEAHLFLKEGTIIHAGVDSISQDEINRLKMYGSSQTLVLDNSAKSEVLELNKSQIRKSKLPILKLGTKKKVCDYAQKQNPSSKSIKGFAKFSQNTSQDFFLSGNTTVSKSLVLNSKTNFNHLLAKVFRTVFNGYSQRKSDEIFCSKDTDLINIFLDGFAGRGPPEFI